METGTEDGRDRYVVTAADIMEAKRRRAEKGPNEPLMLSEKQIGAVACATEKTPQSYPNSRTWCQENFTN